MKENFELSEEGKREIWGNISRTTLDAIDSIKNESLMEITKEPLLRAGAKQLNENGMHFGFVQIGECEKTPLDKDNNTDEGDTLTLDRLKELAKFVVK